MLAKERDGAPPRIGRSFGVINLRALIVKEGVIGAGINYDLNRFAERLHIALQLTNYIRIDALVVLTVKTQHGCMKVRQIGFYFRMATIENDTSAYLVVLCRRIERERAAHAETNDADLFARGRIFR